MYNKEERRLEVFFDHNMNSLINLNSYGHDIEASWLVDRSVEILDDPKYMDKIKLQTVKLKTKRSFFKKGTCSRTFFYILNREFGYPMDAHFFVYLGLTYKSLRKYRKIIKDKYSQIDQINLDWLHLFKILV